MRLKSIGRPLQYPHYSYSGSITHAHVNISLASVLTSAKSFQNWKKRDMKSFLMHNLFLNLSLKEVLIVPPLLGAKTLAAALSSIPMILFSINKRLSEAGLGAR